MLTRPLTMTWPQVTNGNLTKITMAGTTIYNTSTGGGTVTGSLRLCWHARHQRTIAAGACATLMFTFANNVSTTRALHWYGHISAPVGSVMYLP